MPPLTPTLASYSECVVYLLTMTAVVIDVCFMPQILLNGIYETWWGGGDLVLRQTRENRATMVLRKYIIMQYMRSSQCPHDGSYIGVSFASQKL